MKKITILFVFLAMVLLANPVFAGGGHGDQGSSVTGSNKNDNSMGQGQAQTMIFAPYSEGVENRREFPMQPYLNYPSGPATYEEGRPKYNDLPLQKIQHGVSLFTSASIAEFYRRLPKKELEILREEVEMVYYPSAAVPSHGSSSECLFFRDKEPQGQEGLDYFVVAEIEVNAAPDDRKSLRVRANMFKFLAAEVALKNNGNAFAIHAASGDPEHRNGVWGASFTLGAAGAGKDVGATAAMGAGMSRGWEKKQSRPWAYVVVYWIPPQATVIQQEVSCGIEETRRELELCNDLGIKNQALHAMQMQNYICKAKQGQDRARVIYFELAMSEFDSSERNYQIALRANAAEATRIHREALYYKAGIINEQDGQEIADRFANANNLNAYPCFPGGANNCQ